MNNKTWAGLLAVVFLLCLVLSLWLLRPGQDAAQIEIWSDGELIDTLPLNRDQTIEVRTEHGVNVITVQDGKVAVTEADCPDGYCMARGFCGGGPQIVCLPNRLIIRFLAPLEVDSVVG